MATFMLKGLSIYWGCDSYSYSYSYSCEPHNIFWIAQLFDTTSYRFKCRFRFVYHSESWTVSLSADPWPNTKIQYKVKLHITSQRKKWNTKNDFVTFCLQPCQKSFLIYLILILPSFLINITFLCFIVSSAILYFTLWCTKYWNKANGMLRIFCIKSIGKFLKYQKE